ncbi:hypothetical protein BC829DRAFT_447479 [Chytridium lagenaria]|nr:hypothetical protein BC829DRAFT_447479 [Chytridium lagenaria]
MDLYITVPPQPRTVISLDATSHYPRVLRQQSSPLVPGNGTSPTATAATATTTSLVIRASSFPPNVTLQNLPKSITPDVLLALQRMNFTPNPIGAGYLCYADPYSAVGYVLDPTLNHTCRAGFYCPNVDPTDTQNLTLPVGCPPLTECSILRTYGFPCPDISVRRAAFSRGLALGSPIALLEKANMAAAAAAASGAETAAAVVADGKLAAAAAQVCRTLLLRLHLLLPQTASSTLTPFGQYVPTSPSPASSLAWMGVSSPIFRPSGKPKKSSTTSPSSSYLPRIVLVMLLEGWDHRWTHVVPISEITRKPSHALVPSLFQSASTILSPGAANASRSSMSMTARSYMAGANTSADLEANQGSRNISGPMLTLNDGGLDPYASQLHHPSLPHPSAQHHHHHHHHQQYLAQYPPYQGDSEDHQVPLDPATPPSAQLTTPRLWFNKRTWSGVSWTEAMERTGQRKGWSAGTGAPLAGTGGGQNMSGKTSDGVSTASDTSSNGSNVPTMAAVPASQMPAGAGGDLYKRHRRGVGAGLESEAIQGMDVSVFMVDQTSGTSKKDKRYAEEPSRMDMIQTRGGASGTHGRRTAQTVNGTTPEFLIAAGGSSASLEEDALTFPARINNATGDAGRNETEMSSSSASVQTCASVPNLAALANAGGVTREDTVTGRSAQIFIASSDSSSVSTSGHPTAAGGEEVEDVARNDEDGDGDGALRLRAPPRSDSMRHVSRETDGEDLDENQSPVLSVRVRQSRMGEPSRSTLVTFENSMSPEGEAAPPRSVMTQALTDSAAVAGPHVPNQQDAQMLQSRNTLRHMAPPPLQINKPLAGATPGGPMATSASAMGFAPEVQDIVSNVFTEMDMARLVSSWQKGLRMAPNIRMEFSFKNLCVRLPNGREVLKNVSGALKSGRMTAIMGPSGSGKTTLMNVLLGKMKNTSGDILSTTGLRIQAFTVREVILHSGRVRLPPSWTEAEVEEHIDNVIGILGLGYVADTIIGDERDRGISGGQRKRVNVGIELAAVPSLCFLDEPTSGLDATSALLLISLLSAITRYAASSRVFHLFDDVIMLAPSGQVAYAGPVNCVRSYFESVGFEISSGATLLIKPWTFFAVLASFAENLMALVPLHIALVVGDCQDLERRSRRLSRKKSKHGQNGANGLRARAQPMSGSKENISNNSASLNNMSILEGSSGTSPNVMSATSMVANVGDSDQIETVPGAGAVATYDPDQTQSLCCNKVVVDQHRLRCRGMLVRLLCFERSDEDAERVFYASISGLLKDRGASFLQQLLYCHQRSLMQQSRKLAALALEIFVAMFAGFLMGISIEGIPELYRYLSRLLCQTFPVQPGLVGLYGLLIQIAVAMAGAPAGVKVFGEEKTVYWREASSGHSRGAYFLGKTMSTVYGFTISSLHFSAVYYVFAKPVITFNMQYLIILLSFWGIYGLSCIVSMVVRRENAPLLAVVCGLSLPCFAGSDLA